MRAAVLRGHRSAPEVEQWQPPDVGPGEALVELRAAPITPLDLLCASGTSYFGPPELPYVPGVQGVGLVLNSTSVPSGTMAWFSTRAGMAPGDGSLRECCSVAEADLVPLGFDVKPELVAALGLSAVAAWMALTWRGELHPGEQVIVLGAGGTVGQVAVQAARLRGARRVIAGCRSDGAAERARRCGADAVVRLDTDGVAELARRFAEASDGPVDLVIDPLFGAPAAGALRALRHYGRLVQLGSAACETAPIDSSTIRSRCLRLLGYTNNELTGSQRADALNAVLSYASAGQLSVNFESVSLDGISQAWERQARGEAPVRIVVTY
jgi:NADPH:quinone reductase-like Zn-dependent oxidoreductase